MVSAKSTLIILIANCLKAHKVQDIEKILNFNSNLIYNNFIIFLPSTAINRVNNSVNLEKNLILLSQVNSKKFHINKFIGRDIKQF